jgi:DNA-binding transcriptional regulator GbsR (MarR family)
VAETSDIADVAARRRAAEDMFVLEWGRMSSSWGINRTMAQIHALLLITGRPFDMDEIIERLGISRGNASMNLRSLIDWGLVQRFRKPGDRKDRYVSESDMVTVLARLARERKRREIDPTSAAIRDCLEHLPSEDSSPETEQVRRRLEALLDIFALFDALFERAFRNDATLRQTIGDLKSGIEEA